MPGREALRLVARQPGFAVTVLERFDRDLDEIAGLDFDFAAIVVEFLSRDIAFRFETGIYHHEIVVDAQDFGGDDFTDPHFLAGQAFFKQRGETFSSP